MYNNIRESMTDTCPMVNPSGIMSDNFEKTEETSNGEQDLCLVHVDIPPDICGRFRTIQDVSTFVHRKKAER